MSAIAIANFIKTPEGNYQNFSPGETLIYEGDNYAYLSFLYQGAAKSRTGDNLEAGLIVSQNPVSMSIARKIVSTKSTVEVFTSVMNRGRASVANNLTEEIWIAASMTYNPEQVEVVLSSAIDAVGTNAPLRVLMSKDVGRLPTSSQINNA